MDFIEKEKQIDKYEVGKLLDLGMRQVATWKEYGLIKAYKSKGNRYIYNKDEILKVNNFVKPRLERGMTLRAITSEWEKNISNLKTNFIKNIIKILIIDDTKSFLEHIRENLSNFFAKDEVEIYTEDNGEKGIKLAKTLLPDVIIIDYILDGQKKSGLEIAKILENDPNTSKAKIIIISGHIDIDSKDMLFISKPFKTKNLAYEIAKLTGLSSKNDCGAIAHFSEPKNNV